MVPVLLPTHHLPLPDTLSSSAPPATERCVQQPCHTPLSWPRETLGHNPVWRPGLPSSGTRPGIHLLGIVLDICFSQPHMEPFTNAVSPAFRHLGESPLSHHYNYHPGPSPSSGQWHRKEKARPLRWLPTLAQG